MNARGLSRCQRQLLEELGEQYCVNRIDGANCIYRDFGDHDVDICGGRTIRAPFHIFVWQKKPHLEIVERFMDLPHDCKQGCCAASADCTAIRCLKNRRETNHE